jgi:hypothetical protein
MRNAEGRRAGAPDLCRPQQGRVSRGLLAGGRPPTAAAGEAKPLRGWERLAAPGGCSRVACSAPGHHSFSARHGQNDACQGTAHWACSSRCCCTTDRAGGWRLLSAEELLLRRRGLPGSAWVSGTETAWPAGSDRRRAHSPSTPSGSPSRRRSWRRWGVATLSCHRWSRHFRPRRRRPSRSTAKPPPRCLPPQTVRASQPARARAQHTGVRDALPSQKWLSRRCAPPAPVPAT